MKIFTIIQFNQIFQKNSKTFTFTNEDSLRFENKLLNFSKVALKRLV